MVHSSYRRRGVSKYLLGAVEDCAKDLRCCKITLEVLDKNLPAYNSYVSYGFEQYSLDPTFGRAIFMQKILT